MVRLIHWLCFRSARRLGGWPIGVYFALTTPLVLIRHLILPLSSEIVAQSPIWAYPVFDGFVFVGLPVTLWLRIRDWYRPQAREEWRCSDSGARAKGTVATALRAGH